MPMEYLIVVSVACIIYSYLYRDEINF